MNIVLCQESDITHNHHIGEIVSLPMLKTPLWHWQAGGRQLLLSLSNSLKPVLLLTYK